MGAIVNANRRLSMNNPGNVTFGERPGRVDLTCSDGGSLFSGRCELADENLTCGGMQFPVTAPSGHFGKWLEQHGARCDAKRRGLRPGYLWWLKAGPSSGEKVAKFGTVTR
ncbi:MAG: hypothetical protein DMG77_14625 [Acidobacteria bacterium]|nr:MAG: hypothetical protein DMG77_14625 [Acidobacteriota bacterium]